MLPTSLSSVYSFVLDSGSGSKVEVTELKGVCLNALSFSERHSGVLTFSIANSFLNIFCFSVFQGSTSFTLIFYFSY